jgi:protocatechuate 3,4-dioxygenase beta subunit
MAVGKVEGSASSIAHASTVTSLPRILETGLYPFTTGSNGEYRFRTIKPVPYSGRTAHIHFRVNRGGREVLTTQAFINGFSQNNSDGVLSGIRDLVDRELVLVDFKPVKGSKIGELSARFEVVVGVTPSDRPEARKSRRRG